MIRPLPQYSVNPSQLLTRSILISVWHHGRLSRNTFLGEAEIPLDSRDLESTHLDRVALLAKVDPFHTLQINKTKQHSLIAQFTFMEAAVFLRFLAK